VVTEALVCPDVTADDVAQLISVDFWRVGRNVDGNRDFEAVVFELAKKLRNIFKFRKLTCRWQSLHARAISW
jgi:hypothetical protein